LLDQSSIHQGVAGKVKTLEATAGLGAKASGDVLRVMGPIRARSATTQAKTDAMTAPAPKAPEMPVRKTPTTKSSDVAPKATKGLYFEKASSAFLEEDGTTNRNVPTMVRPEAPPSSPENPPPRLNLHAFRESEGTLPPDSTPSELVASQASGGLPRIHGETSSGQGLLGSTTPKDMPLDRRSVRAPKWFYGLLVVLALIVLATAVLTLVRSRQAFEPVSKEAK
jgi:hypothetical protein